MTNQEKEFLRLHVMNGIDYKTISEQMRVPKEILTEWYEKLRPEREEIAKIKNFWSRKKFTPTFEKFYDWHLLLDRRCEYCGITEEEIEILINKNSVFTKRITTRGKNLEYDRKLPNLEYSQIDNIVLCCYWCNNAKTDEFSYEEFKKVGEVFAEIWKKRLS